MENRSPLSVFVLGLITFGIYSLVWSIKTKGEMVRLGADIPTAWLLIVPFANIWWVWKWSLGVEHVTGGKVSGMLAFLVEWLLGPIGDAIIQDSFNKLAGPTTSPYSQPPTNPLPPSPIS